jgi:hypothetical protein
MQIVQQIKKHLAMIPDYKKGDLLLYHLDKGGTKQLLVVHVVEEKMAYYCWDRLDKLYRLVYACPKLTLLCPDFDPDFPCDLDWEAEEMLRMYYSKYRPTKQFED